MAQIATSISSPKPIDETKTASPIMEYIAKSKESSDPQEEAGDQAAGTAAAAAVAAAGAGVTPPVVGLKASR